MIEYSYSTPVVYDGEYYLSETEATWAAYFDECGMPFEHEANTFELPAGDFYTPDFFLPEQDAYLEVKSGNIDADAVYKIGKLARSLGKTGILVDGKPHNMNVYFFSPTSDKFLYPSGGRPAEAASDFRLNKANFLFPNKKVVFEGWLQPRIKISQEIMKHAIAARDTKMAVAGLEHKAAYHSRKSLQRAEARALVV